MEILSIGVPSVPDNFEELLATECRKIKNLNIEKKSSKDYVFFSIKFIGGKLSFNNYLTIKETLKLITSPLIAKIIINTESETGSQYLSKKYSYLEKHDKALILKKITPALEKDQSSRYETVLKDTIAYLETHSQINIDGFKTFGLKAYLRQVEDVVDQVLEDYIVALEYEDFLGVFRWFFQTNDVKTEFINIVIDTEITILDQNDSKINIPEIDHLSHDDALITALMYTSPEKILLHIKKDPGNATKIKEILETLYPGNVEVCPGCSLCLN